jgi:hypothetical protein
VVSLLSRSSDHRRGPLVNGRRSLRDNDKDHSASLVRCLSQSLLGRAALFEKSSGMRDVTKRFGRKIKDGISSEDHWVPLAPCLQRGVTLTAAAIRDVDGDDQWKGPEELGCSHIIHVSLGFCTVSCSGGQLHCARLLGIGMTREAT